MALTPDEIHTARLLRRESKTIEQIARIMNRSRTSIGEACRGYARVNQQQAYVVVVPDHVKAERDRRLALPPRDLTAAIAGDPLPGMSALERRKKAPLACRSHSALVLRSAAKLGVSKEEGGPSFETRRFGPLLRMRANKEQSAHRNDEWSMT